MSARFDPAHVDALLADAPPSDPALAAAARWLSGDGSLDDVDLPAALAAVEAARRGGDRARLQSLKRARHKLVKRAARAALLDIPAVQRDGRTFTLDEAAANHWDGAWISAPNPDGYVQCIIGWADQDMVGALSGEIGGGEGIRRSDVIQTTRRHLRKIAADMDDETQMRSIPLTTALWLWLEASDTWAGLQGRLNDDWKRFRDGLPEGTLNAARLISPFRDMPALPDGPVPEMTELMRVMNVHAWDIEPARLVAASMEYMQFHQSTLEISGAARQERLDGIAAQGADAMIDEENRAATVRRMEKAALYFKSAGWDDVAQEAWFVARALDAGRSGSEVPYLCALALSQIEHGLAGALGFDHDHLHRH